MKKLMYFYEGNEEYVVTSLRHFTPQNSSRRARDGKAWKTTAEVTQTSTGKTASAVSYCARHDTPNRRIGREVAIGRAIKALART